MDCSEQVDLPLGVLAPNDPQWRSAAKAMGRCAPAPPIKHESARLYYRCKSLYKRASAKLLHIESSKTREHSSLGVR